MTTAEFKQVRTVDRAGIDGRRLAAGLDRNGTRKRPGLAPVSNTSHNGNAARENFPKVIGRRSRTAVVSGVGGGY